MAAAIPCHQVPTALLSHFCQISHQCTISDNFKNLSVAIDNWSRFPLIDPQTDLECGRHIGALPEVIVPGTSEMALFEKGVIVNIKRQNILQAVPLKLDFCNNQTK